MRVFGSLLALESLAATFISTSVSAMKVKSGVEGLTKYTYEVLSLDQSGWYQQCSASLGVKVLRP